MVISYSRFRFQVFLTTTPNSNSFLISFASGETALLSAKRDKDDGKGLRASRIVSTMKSAVTGV